MEIISIKIQEIMELYTDMRNNNLEMNDKEFQNIMASYKKWADGKNKELKKCLNSIL